MSRLYTNRCFANSSNSYNQLLPTCPTGELRTTQRTSLMDLKSVFGLSAIREYSTLLQGGTITGGNTTSTGEHLLSTTSTLNSTAALQSAERVGHQVAFGSEMSIGIRIAALPAGQVAKFGLFDGINGVYFQYDTVNKLSCNVMRASVVTQAPQSTFNIDPMDGTGPSGIVLDISSGSMFKLLFSPHAYGSAVFSVITQDSSYNLLAVPVHQFSMTGGNTSVAPHVPIRVELKNVSATAAGALYLSGRQFSVLGPYCPPTRVTPVVSTYATFTTTGTRLCAFRRKVGFSNIRMYLDAIEISSASGLFVSVYQQAVVIGGAWVAPSYATATETALEINTSFTQSTDGVLVYTSFFSNSANIGAGSGLGVPLTETDNFVLQLTNVTGKGNQLADAILIRCMEEW